MAWKRGRETGKSMREEGVYAMRMAEGVQLLLFAGVESGLSFVIRQRENLR